MLMPSAFVPSTLRPASGSGVGVSSVGEIVSGVGVAIGVSVGAAVGVAARAYACAVVAAGVSVTAGWEDVTIGSAASEDAAAAAAGEDVPVCPAS